MTPDPAVCRVVCISGGMRYPEELEEAARRETLAGRVVLPLVHLGADEGELASDVKARLDRAHLQKVELAHELFVVDVRGYVGDSTRREVEHARRRGMRIRYWSLEVEPRCPWCVGTGRLHAVGREAESCGTCGGRGWIRLCWPTCVYGRHAPSCGRADPASTFGQVAGQ